MNYENCSNEKGPTRKVFQREMNEGVNHVLALNLNRRSGAIATGRLLILFVILLFLYGRISLKPFETWNTDTIHLVQNIPAPVGATTRNSQVEKSQRGSSEP